MSCQPDCVVFKNLPFVPAIKLFCAWKVCDFMLLEMVSAPVMMECLCVGMSFDTSGTMFVF